VFVPGPLEQRWDVGQTGFITKHEFVHPERGLLNFVRANLLHEATIAPLALPDDVTDDVPAPPTPERLQSPLTPSAFALDDESGARWFRAYDDTRSGRLTRDQLLRALVKSLPNATIDTAETVLAQLADALPELSNALVRSLQGPSDGARGPAEVEAITLEQFLAARKCMAFIIDAALPLSFMDAPVPSSDTPWS
jgi:hypothetical protein